MKSHNIFIMGIFHKSLLYKKITLNEEQFTINDVFKNRLSQILTSSFDFFMNII